MERSKIDNIYKWDLTKIYKSIADFNKEFEEVSIKLNDYNKHYNFMESASSLLEFLKYDEDVSRKVEKLYTYAHLTNDAEMSDSKNQEIYGRVCDLYSKYSEVSSFVNPTLLKYDYDKIESYYKEIPELKNYDKIFKEIFRYKPYTLSDKEELIISSLSKSLSGAEENYSYLTDVDMKFAPILVDGKEEELTESNYSVYLKHKDREVRKDAFKKILSKYGEYKNTIASMLSNHIDTLTTLARIKGYKSSLEASLFNEEIDPIIYDNLIDTVSNHLDVLFKYYEAKKQMLKLDELHLYDTYVDVTNNYDKKYTFDEAKDLVINATSILGSEYTKILKKAFDESWIDIYPNDSKRGGAYSGGCYDTLPYVLLNYEGTFNDVSTLAHELGHSMHSYLTRNNNPYVTGDYKIFVAEVASTVNELLLDRYVLENSKDPHERLSVLNELMGLYKATIYRQVMFAEFEKNIHSLKEEGTILTNELLCDIYYKLNQKYFGSNVIVDDLIKNEWMRIPHFYYNFYVYKYAIGLSCASKIVSDIYSNREGAKEAYLNFLKSGSKKSPLELLKDAGCDFKKPEVIEEAIKTFEILLNDYIETYKKSEGE